MTEIKIKQKEKEENGIDFSSLEDEVVKEREELKIKEKQEEKDKKQFKPDKKLWMIGGIAAVVIVVAAVAFAYWPM